MYSVCVGILTFARQSVSYCTVYVWDSYFHRAECAALYSFYVGILTFERHSVSYCTVYVWGFSPSLGTVSRIVHFMCGDSYFHLAECANLYIFYVRILTFERHSVSYCTVYVWGFLPSLGTVSRIVQFMCGDSYFHLAVGNSCSFLSI